MKKWLETKRRIVLSGIDRRDIAEQMGLSYSYLNQKICGFVDWSPEELGHLEEILTAEPDQVPNT